MAPVTEFVSMRLKPSATAILDPETSEGRTMADAKTYLANFGGVQFHLVSPRIENKQIMHEFVVWDSEAAYQKFNTHAGMPDFAAKVLALADPPNNGDFSQSYFAIEPAPQTVLGSPATEVLFVYFPADVDAPTMATHNANVERFFEVTKGPAVGRLTGHAAGWSTGAVDVPADKAPGGKARVHMTLLGWNSVAAHHEFREYKEFPEGVKLYGDWPREMYHVGKGDDELGTR